jgi:DNA repair protein RadC
MKYKSIPIYSLLLVKEKELQYPLPKISNSHDAKEILQEFLRDKDCEYLVVLLLNHENEYLGLSVVAMGGLTGVSTHTRDVFKAPIRANANAIILGHNHPSGNILPSQQDIDFTKKIIAASKIIEIPVLDHIIVSSGPKDGWFSFLEKGLL